MPCYSLLIAYFYQHSGACTVGPWKLFKILFCFLQHFFLVLVIFSLTRQVLTLFQKPVEQQVRLFIEVKVRLAFSSVQYKSILLFIHEITTYSFKNGMYMCPELDLNLGSKLSILYLNLRSILNHSATTAGRQYNFF